MRAIVSKFGGSSIADARRFKLVRQILAPARGRRYIILSAPGCRADGDEKVTDLLCRAHHLMASGQDAEPVLQQVRTRFESIIRALRLPIDPDGFLSGLEDDVRFSRDRAASRGEFLCAKLFAAYADLPFVDAAALIHFDENGRIQRDRIASSIRAMADRLPCAVIPGFYGSLPSGEIKTFSRGGSDITGALVAAALNADLYENWTDVDGLMSADPALCPDAVCHPAVSYRQMRLLARAGAQVLHPYCLEPVCEAGVPTALYNTFAPRKPGTYISDSVHANARCVCTLRGLTAAPLDALSDEARAVAGGLGAERLSSPNGREWILLKDTPSLGRPVSLLTAFGLRSDKRKRAVHWTNPLACLFQDEIGKFLVEPGRERDALRALHRLVMEGASKPAPTAARIDQG